MGGPSAEREISLVTGKAVVDNLDTKKYLPSVIEMDAQSFFWLKQKGKKRKLDLQNKDRKLFDIIFIALHGSPGEDGGVQGMLESLQIKYTGSGVLASALAMNKVYSAQIYFANNLPYPPFIHFKRAGWQREEDKIIENIINTIGFPVVIKPVDQGSAVGVSIVKSKEDLKEAIDQTIKSFPWLMAQQFVKGQEATCGVLEKNGEIFALPPTRIVPNAGQFYDYASKYRAGGSAHICPADFPVGVNEDMQRLAQLAHKALRCKGMSRTDIFYADEENKDFNYANENLGTQTSDSYRGNKRLYIIETNTIPGMTPTSLLPEAAAKAGISFAQMLDGIIKASL